LAKQHTLSKARVRVGRRCTLSFDEVRIEVIGEQRLG
jgi:hypothetical protein